MRFKTAFPYVVSLLVLLLVVWSNFRGQGPASTDSHGPMVDPVCNMEVNAKWGFHSEFEGETYWFCTEMCCEEFDEDPSEFLSVRCMVCDEEVDGQEGAVEATYLEKTYLLCSEEHRHEFKTDPAAYFMHRMWGIPDWLYYVSIALVLLVSFFSFEGTAAVRRMRPAFSGVGGGSPGSPTIALPILNNSATATDDYKFDLMRFAPIRFMMRSRPFRFCIQFVMVVFFLLIIAAGLFGNQNPALNIAPLLTWTIWWCGLVVLIMFAGKAWCFMCPWDAIAGWMEKLRFWKKTDGGLGLGMKWPRRLRNIWLATFLFVGLTWVELGFGITMSPAATAYVALAMLVMAIVCAFLYDRKSFCRYGCLVGRVSGLYAMFGGIEIRSQDTDVCQTCRTKECIKGSETAYGCPTFEYPGAMNVNTYCIQCGECLQSCPHENMTMRLRPWGEDLAAEVKPRSDEAYLALLMLAISGFHGLTMTPVWGQLTGAIETAVPIAGRVAAFSLGMAGLMLAPIAVYAALVWVSFWLVDRSSPDSTQGHGYKDYFVRYAYCVLPIALFYHLAHNLEHLLMEGPKVLAMFSDPFGWGWNLFGSANWHVPPLVSLDVLWIMQVFLVGIGHVYSLWAAQKISRRMFANETAASRGQWPMLIGMIAFSVLSLWLLKQPMEMRTSAM